MILGFMQKFPWGEPTLFREKILHGAGWINYEVQPFDKANNYQPKPRKIYFPGIPGLSGGKIHTIRVGQRWKPGMKIQMATGVRTKQYYQFNKDIPELQEVKSVQRIDIIHRGPGCCIVFIDHKTLYSRMNYTFYVKEHNRNGFLQFLQNDGLTEEQFWKYFGKFGNLRNGQLISWTDLKY